MLAVMKNEKMKGAAIGETQIPSIGHGDLLVKVKAASICGTDVHIYNWDGWAANRIKPPMIFGHEFCGEVIETGDMVKGVKKGDYISAESHIPCGYCYQCQNNQMHICQNLKILGIDINGSFAEYVSLPEVCAWKNPADMPIEIASIQEPLGNAVYAVLAEEVAGKSVVVFGCGPSGLFSTGVAAASGAYPVISVIKHEFRREIAKKMGANVILKTGEDLIVEGILKATSGQGADVVLEMTGNPDAIHQAFQVVKKGGRVTLFGISSEPVSLDMANQIIFKGIRVYGINGRVMYQTWHKMRSLLQSGKLNPKPVITHQFSLSEFEKGMTAMTAKDRKCGKVVLFA
jgi:threonine 3-dehydrogenase